MDKKDFIYDVTSALESAPEASLEGEVRGTWMSTRSPAGGPQWPAAGTDSTEFY